jgi:predicted metalloprotease
MYLAFDAFNDINLVSTMSFVEAESQKAESSLKRLEFCGNERCVSARETTRSASCQQISALLMHLAPIEPASLS